MDSGLVTEKYNYKTFRANSGAIRFRIIVDPLSSRLYPKIYLIGDECPHENLFMIILDYHIGTIRIKDNEGTTYDIRMPMSLLSFKSTEMWLSWYKSYFRMGLLNDGVLAEHQLVSLSLLNKPTVGFIKFRCSDFINFDLKDPLVSVTDRFKEIKGGKLRWVKIRNGYELPVDAVIGGYQGEVTYVARAEHNGSICPGKYMPSKLLAYVPWGFEEHAKNNFEILCGYNYMWIKCKSPYLPDNAFKAGKSEVHDEPLYIGRAMIGDTLVSGKVHMLYESCYLPLHGSEVCTKNFEVLVAGNCETSERNWRRKCFMVNCSQPYP